MQGGPETEVETHAGRTRDRRGDPCWADQRLRWRPMQGGPETEVETHAGWTRDRGGDPCRADQRQRWRPMQGGTETEVGRISNLSIQLCSEATHFLYRTVIYSL
jgi:hypothetical protein